MKKDNTRKYAAGFFAVLLLTAAGFIVSCLIVNQNRTAFGYEYEAMEGDSLVVEDVAFQLLVYDESKNNQYWSADFQMKQGEPELAGVTHYSTKESARYQLREETGKQLNREDTMNLWFTPEDIDYSSDYTFQYETGNLAAMTPNQRVHMDKKFSRYTAELYLLQYSLGNRAESFRVHFPAINVSDNEYYSELTKIEETKDAVNYYGYKLEPEQQTLSMKAGNLAQLGGVYYFTLKNTLSMSVRNISNSIRKQDIAADASKYSSAVDASGSSYASGSSAGYAPDAKDAVFEGQPDEADIPFHYTATSGIWCITDDKELVNLYPIEISEDTDFQIRGLYAVPDVNSLILLTEKENAVYAIVYRLDTDTVEEAVLLYRFPENMTLRDTAFTAYPDGSCLNLVYDTGSELIPGEEPYSLLITFDAAMRTTLAVCDLAQIDFGQEVAENQSCYIERKEIRYEDGRFYFLYAVQINQDYWYLNTKYYLYVVENNSCIYKGRLTLNIIDEDVGAETGYYEFPVRRVDYLVFGDRDR